jgi:hypothetical protein
VSRRRRHNSFAQLDASRRVGWAKYYQQSEENEQLQLVVQVLRSRVEDLVPEFLRLKDAVLHERNVVAFNQAYRVEQLIRSVIDGAPRREYDL